MKVYCFGNEFLKEDSLAKEIADSIKIEGVKFIKCNSPEDIFESEQERIIILDVVEDIEKVILIEDLEQLKDNKIISLHDFDLSFFLKLMKEMGKIKKVQIIGIPMKGNKENMRGEIRKIISKITF
ncbi:MAG: hypothetical protein U9O94_01860 [Nanoarchaeota archaeon]|nr:hypothetical protein [Nanoarchaeota archaeon]